jgi:hypothetical protein
MTLLYEDPGSLATCPVLLWQNHLRNKGFISQDHIGGFSMKQECTSTHIQAYNTIYEIQVKVITDWVPCIRVYKRWSLKDASKDNQSFCGSIHLSRQTHTFYPRREWASSDDLPLWVPVGNPTLIGLDLPLTALIGIARRRRKILTYTQIHKNNKSKSLSNYAQQDLSVATWRLRILDMQRFQVK